MLGIFLDLETTGLDPSRHSPIDLAFKVVNLDSGEVKTSFQSLIKQPKEVWNLADPMSIEINGYSFEEVSVGEDPKVLAEEIVSLMNELGVVRRKAVFICQNPAFDRAFFTQIISVYRQEELNWPYHWLDLASMYWTRLYDHFESERIQVPDLINLSKNAIAAYYGIATEGKPHRAINGVNHLIECYRTVLKVRW